MERFLLSLLSLTLGGSFIAGLILLLRRCIPNRLPKSFYYYAWLLVLLRMALPVPGLLSPELPKKPVEASQVMEEVPVQTNEAPVFPALPPVQEAAAPTEAPVVESLPASTLPAPAVSQTVPEKLAPLPPEREFTILHWVTLIWAVGCAAFLVRDLVGYFRFRHTIRKTLTAPLPSDMAVYYALAGKRRPRLRRSGAVDTPMLMGVIRPVLLLPDRDYAPETLCCIFRHELTHYQRRDILYKWFAMPVLAVHWFNPLTYFMRRDIDRCCELSCDERILKEMDHDQRRSYGQTLLALAAGSSPARTSLSTTFATEKKNLKERLVQIMNFSPKSKLALGCAALLLAAVGLCCLLFGPMSGPSREGEAYVVRNVDQLLEVLGPNTEIILEPGTYDLTEAKTYGIRETKTYGEKDTSPYYRWEECNDGYALIIQNVENLTIRGRETDKCEIVTRPRYAAVLSFEHCENIDLSAFTAGHTEGPGGCVGAVICLGETQNVAVTDCALYGCGTYGVEAGSCVNVDVKNCDIYDCSLGAVTFAQCRNVQVADSRIYDCGDSEYAAYQLFSFRQCHNCAVTDCEITSSWADTLMETGLSQDIRFLGNTVDMGEGYQLETVFRSEGTPPIVDGCAFAFQNEDIQWIGEGSVLSPDGEELGSEDLKAMTHAPSGYKIHKIEIADPPLETVAVAEGDTTYPENTTVVRAATVDEFLAAINPNTTVVLAEGVYDLSTASDFGLSFDGYYSWNETQDGCTLELKDLTNFHILGAGKSKTTIAAVPRYADVLSFRYCTDLSIEGLTVGHTEEPGSCDGGVLTFQGCGNVAIRSCGLYGCGTIGIEASSCNGFLVKDTEIYDCSLAGLDLYGCRDFALENCNFHDLPCIVRNLSLCGNITMDGQPLLPDDVLPPAEDLEEASTGNVWTPTEPDDIHTAQSLLLYNRDEGSEVYSLNPDARVEPGTLAQMVTALIALENGSPEDPITVDIQVVRKAIPHLDLPYFEHGQVLTLGDLAACSVMNNTKDAACLLANHISGNQQAFVELMNQRVRDMGCTDTHFTHPAGLDDGNAYTTAHDLVKILETALQNEDFRRYFEMIYYEIPDPQAGGQRQMLTNNYMMSQQVIPDFYDPRVTGGKQSASEQAGASLIITAEDSGVRYIGVVLGSRRDFDPEITWRCLRYGNFEEMAQLLAMLDGNE